MNSRRRTLRSRLAAGSLCAVLSGAAACGGQGPIGVPDPDALGLLFVGNSLTYFNDMPLLVQELLEEAGLGPVVVASTSYPNFGLQDHWTDGRARDAIELGNWDHVLLQQGPSATEGRPSLLEYSRRFDAEIRDVGATTGLYMVWPAETRDFDFDGVVESYALAAAGVDGLLFPGGAAWIEVWKADPTIELYGPDRFHPSLLGSYVVALTIADRLIDGDWTPDHVLQGISGSTPIDPALGALLLAAARRANLMYPGAAAR